MNKTYLVHYLANHIFTWNMNIKLTRFAFQLQCRIHPLSAITVITLVREDVLERLDKGLSDFGIVFTPVDNGKHNFIKIPLKDEWGILMRRDSTLAEKESIGPPDIIKQPLILSRQQSDKSPVIKWFGKKFDKLNIVSTYNLVYNASVMVKERIGYALAFDKLINVSGDSELCFRPLNPPVYAEMHFIWNKYQIMTKSAEKFLEYLRAEI